MRSPYASRAASTTERQKYTSSASRDVKLLPRGGDTAGIGSALDEDRDFVGMHPLVRQGSLGRITEEEHQVHEAIRGNVEFPPKFLLIEIFCAIHQTTRQTQRGRGEAKLQ